MADKKTSEILRTAGYVPKLRICDGEEAWLQTLRTATPITTGSVAVSNNHPRLAKHFRLPIIAQD
jgi:hypothetical protein